MRSSRTFLLQKDARGHLDVDVEAVRGALLFNAWRDNIDPEGVYIITEDPQDALRTLLASGTAAKDIIPVGTIEFTVQALSAAMGTPCFVSAINIPPELQKEPWLQRNVLPAAQLTEECFDQFKANALFVKPAYQAKQFDALIVKKAELRGVQNTIGDQRVFISTLLPAIVAEWRIFVYKGRILDARPYILDEWVAPDKKTVKEMVNAYGVAAPIAYTMDVAITGSGETVLIEVHNFLCCGLYGFESELLPNMIAAAWRYELDKASKISVERRA